VSSLSLSASAAAANSSSFSQLQSAIGYETEGPELWLTIISVIRNSGHAINQSIKQNFLEWPK